MDTVLFLIKLISLTANAILFLVWLRSKIFLRYYLPGRWEGVLLDSEDGSFVIECVLVVTCHNKICKGFLVYTAKAKGEAVALGIDSVKQYDDRDFWPNEWNPILVREFHQFLKQEILIRDSSVFKFKFSIKRRWFRSQMTVSTTNQKNRELSGIWYRQ